jgi:dihydroorotate dehydrogenase
MIPSALISAAMPLIRLMDAETAHLAALRWLAPGFVRGPSTPDPALLQTRVMGLNFSNPIGLAAGFDKNADAVIPLMKLGFGFVEAGTVTPRPQAGNPRPRLFRLTEDRAIINRMGFNNGGIDAFLEKLRALPPRPAPFGTNIGINKEGADPELDYPALARAVAPFADYIVINVSSPNTPGLRDLQSEQRLAAILAAVAKNVPVRPPLLIKIAPDLADSAVDAVIDTAIAHGADGIIISNTTIARPDSLRGRNRLQAGGLSGPPVFARSTELLRRAYKRAGKKLVFIGCGGVGSGADAFAKIAAGASLVQLYTAFAYDGPALIPRIKHDLAQILTARGFKNLADAVGYDA